MTLCMNLTPLLCVVVFLFSAGRRVASLFHLMLFYVNKVEIKKKRDVLVKLGRRIVMCS